MFITQIRKYSDFFFFLLLNTFTNYYASVLCVLSCYCKDKINEVIYLFLRDKNIRNDLCYGYFPILNREFLLTFFCRTQWKMNINIPCRELNIVKRYAMMTVLSLIYMSPKAQVNPNRQRRAIAPITHDL